MAESSPSGNKDLKDIYNRETVEKIADGFVAGWSEFKRSDFIEQVVAGLDERSFLERMNWIAEQLQQFLPVISCEDDFRHVVDLLIIASGPELVENDLKGYGGFFVLPLTRFVSLHGLDYFDESMRALYELTKRFSAEFDIRYFILQHQQRTLDTLKLWHRDSNCHVRRLISEGIRPRLPMGFQLKSFIADPAPVIELLTLIKDDKERFVQRSIANCLNDISKDNPQAVIDTLMQWQQENNSKDLQWMIRHSLRSLIKAGKPEALALLGYKQPQLTVHSARLDHSEIVMGETITFNAELHSNAEQSQTLLIDYALHFQKKNGKTRPKVFRLGEKTLLSSKPLLISASQLIKTVSVRTCYPGEHLFELIINGQPFDQISFNVLAEKDFEIAAKTDMETSHV